MCRARDNLFWKLGQRRMLRALFLDGRVYSTTLLHDMRQFMREKP
jgi:hypothetical protein